VRAAALNNAVKIEHAGRLLAGDLVSAPLMVGTVRPVKTHDGIACTLKSQTCKQHPGREERMPRLAIIDRADMNA
jgi:hypothetical protein